MKDGKLQVGFIGNGKSTNRYHAPFILNRPDTFEIKTIYRRSPNRDAWDSIAGTEYTTDLDSMLADPDIDLVVVSTRHDTHYEFAKKVLEAGKHCLVEKPFANSAKEAAELFELAAEKGLVLSAYQNRRFDSDFMTVKKVIESGKIGDLLELEMHYDYFRPEVPEKTESFSKDTSFVYTHACHTLDQVISFFGKPDRVRYDVKQLLGPGRMNDYFDIDLYYGPVKVSVKSSFFRIKPRASFIAWGTKGMFIKETRDRQEDDLKKFYLPKNHPDFGLDRPEEYGVLTYMDEDGYHEEKVVSEKGDYGLFYDALYQTIVNGKEQLVKPEETLLQMEMLEEAVKDLT